MAQQDSVEKRSVVSSDIPEEIQRSAVSHDPVWAKKTIRKIDLRLLPILGALYSMALIDRGNLPNARVAGAGVELGLTIGNRYSIASLVFFIPYILLEIPSNILFRRVGAARWLGGLTFIWGVVVLGMGFVNDWRPLVVCRVLLGILEAGFFPCAVWLISTWYIRAEVQKRLAGFYLLTLFASGFANILAYGIVQMSGLAGYLGWRWLFIILGLITIVVGVLGYFLIVDFPDKNTFLTEEQTKFVIDRVEQDRGDSEHDALTWSKIGTYAAEWQIWAIAVIFLCTTVPAYALGYFLPIILQGALRFSALNAQLLTAPPYIAAGVFSLGIAFLSDRVVLRGPFIAFHSLLTVTGLSMAAFATGSTVRYAGIFLGMIGCQGNIPCILTFKSNNVVGQSKRSFASAIVIGFGGIGGIIATTVFREADFPQYRPGIITAIALQGLLLVLLAAVEFTFKRRNDAVRSGRSAGNEGRDGFLYIY